MSIYLYLSCRFSLCSCYYRHYEAEDDSPHHAEEKMQPRLWLGRRESLSRLSAGEGTALPRLAVQKCRDSELPNGWGTALQSCGVPTHRLFLVSSEGLQ